MSIEAKKGDIISYEDANNCKCELLDDPDNNGVVDIRWCNSPYYDQITLTENNHKICEYKS